MRNRTYGGVRGRKTKVGRKLLRFPPTRFKEVLDVDNVAICYAADRLQTVTSRNNSKLVLLLDKLTSHDVITYNWQSVIAQKHLVISSSGKKLLTQHDMSSTLNRIKDTTPNAIDKQFLAIIDKYITLIKNKEV